MTTKKLNETVVRGTTKYLVVGVKGEEFIGYRWEPLKRMAKFALSEDGLKTELGLTPSTTGKGLTSECSEFNLPAFIEMMKKNGYEVAEDQMQLIANDFKESSDDYESE